VLGGPAVGQSAPGQSLSSCARAPGPARPWAAVRLRPRSAAGAWPVAARPL